MQARRWLAQLLVAAATLLARPPAGEAQWVEEPGKGWGSLTIYHQDTRHYFGIMGNKRPFVLDGHAVATSGFLTADIGLFPGVDVWIQPSFHRLWFRDAAGRQVSRGPGDARFYLRISPLRALGRAVPLAIRGGVKIPLGDFDVGSPLNPGAGQLIPLGDGQTDYEMLVEMGRSFYPKPLYLMGWLGYRWRAKNTSTGVDYGDERFFLAAAGGELGRVSYKLTLDAIYGEAPRTSGGPAPGAEREILRVNPTLALPLGPGLVEVGVRRPLSGKNLPAGTDFTVGYFTRWALWN